MSKAHITKHTLLLSIVSLFLCMTMLVGTTFAWFTDSASTAVNKIQAGTLDIELQYLNDDGVWKDAEGQTLDFKKVAGHEGESILWEPGCTYELPAIRIMNKGDLALKYKLVITGIKGSAKLNEVIEWTAGEDELLSEYTGTMIPGQNDNVTDPIVIKGHMKESAGNEYQGESIEGIAITVVATQLAYEFDSNNNNYDDAALLPVSSNAVGNLTVLSSSVQNDATVSIDQTISDGVMSVTYPANVKLGNTGEVTGDAEKKTVISQSLTYIGDAPSTAMSGVAIDSGKAVAQYELTLPVADDNTTPVTVTIKYTAGLTGVAVYHNGTLLTATANANGESASYDAATGILTLVINHASPIDIVYNSVLPENSKIVKTVEELKQAITNGETYIVLSANIDLTGNGGSEQVNVLNDATIDLNGYTLYGSVWSGSYLSSADNTRLTLTDSVGSGQIYSTFRFANGSGGAMMQANAVTAWQHAVTINGGVYQSNNVAIVCQIQNTSAAEGVIINGGTFKGSDDLIAVVGPAYPVGSCVEAVIGTVTINGGTFEAAQYGSVIIAESGSSRVDTVVNIYGGTFSGACMFDFGEDHSSKSIINVYGGDFTVKSPDGSELEATSFAYDNYTGAALVNNDMFELNIMGGTFNMDPSAYVDTDNYTVTQNGSTWTVTAK